jgi:hypothetical protein
MAMCMTIATKIFENAELITRLYPFTLCGVRMILGVTFSNEATLHRVTINYLFRHRLKRKNNRCVYLIFYAGKHWYTGEVNLFRSDRTDFLLTSLRKKSGTQYTSKYRKMPLNNGWHFSTLTESEQFARHHL